eukprot:3489435-Pyramimonas_sp.AAC.1
MEIARGKTRAFASILSRASAASCKGDARVWLAPSMGGGFGPRPVEGRLSRAPLPPVDARRGGRDVGRLPGPARSSLRRAPFSNTAQLACGAEGWLVASRFDIEVMPAAF